jgi:TRAP-type C4-dicarboxylate transport system permease small subunit
MNGRRLRSLVIFIAGGALLVAVAVDTLAMIGRQIRLPLLGSIELVQAAVLIAAAGAVMLATADAAHARINLLFNRLPPHWRLRFERLHALAAALLSAALLAGTVWIAAELWAGHEESELLRIPYRPLRMVTAVCFGVVLVLFLRGLRQRGARR